jgi:hypothetical protein
MFLESEFKDLLSFNDEEKRLLLFSLVYNVGDYNLPTIPIKGLEMKLIGENVSSIFFDLYLVFENEELRDEFISYILSIIYR